MNCCVPPAATDAPIGVTAMDERVGAVTLSVAVPVTPDWVAEMVAVPGERAEASPPAATVAMEVFDEVQVAWPPRSWVLPSE
ncbi:hypothetical protein PSR1_02232 [Anaeromyxobacter sp. PSR-1]|nr:hypothetical protein PSR1_02232 [Anaeromyxobacter sp. PSR-1]